MPIRVHVAMTTMPATMATMAATVLCDPCPDCHFWPTVIALLVGTKDVPAESNSRNSGRH
jgi:hypothetical protein